MEGTFNGSEGAFGGNAGPNIGHAGAIASAEGTFGMNVSLKSPENGFYREDFFGRSVSVGICGIHWAREWSGAEGGSLPPIG